MPSEDMNSQHNRESLAELRLSNLQELPPPGVTRWVARRKAEVVAGVRAGLISLEEACRRYSLSVEEFLSWQRLIEQDGLKGLRTTRLKDYRAGLPLEDDSPA